jgi:hypothetical protein
MVISFTWLYEYLVGLIGLDIFSGNVTRKNQKKKKQFVVVLVVSSRIKVATLQNRAI